MVTSGCAARTVSLLLKPYVTPQVIIPARFPASRVRQELDETVLRRANPIFVTSKETLCVNESDIFRAVRDKVIGWDKVHEISNLLLGQVAGRSNDRQITLFKLQGTGIMDVAIGFEAYKRLKDSRLAQSL